MRNQRPIISRNAIRWTGLAAVAWLVTFSFLTRPADAQTAVEAGVVAAGTKPAAGVTRVTAAAAPTKTAAAAPGPKTTAQGAPPAPATPPAPAPVTSAPVCVGELPGPLSVAVVAGKSTLLKLPGPITLRTLGDEEVVQARLLSPEALYLLGLGIGATNMILQDAAGRCTIVDVSVGMDGSALQSKLAQLMPGGKDIVVTAAADTLVLTGTVSDVIAVDQAVMLANAYVRGTLDKGRLGASQAGGDANGGRQSARVVNMLSVAAPQQVLLEVKVAEVSKSLIDKLGASLNLQKVSGGWTYSILTDFLVGGAGLLDAFRKATGEFITIDAEKKDGLVKILAEPNLMAISGQEGSFHAGGTVYFPVTQSGTFGAAPTITLQPEDFGVKLKFTPTVLEGGRINLRVTPEVSELAPEGVVIQAVSAAGRTIAPVITARRASTTVQLFDGQSFAIGGLIKNNAMTDIKAFPLLGEIPVIGALFRSTSFQTDKTELLFVVTPHLVKPIAANYRLPTDAYIPPSRTELFLGGKMEGSPPEPAPTVPPAPAAPLAPNPPKAPSGFQLN
jgi:pilus assembly protein CpaC